MWQCSKVVFSGSPKDGWKVDYAIVKDLLQNEVYHIHAKVFVIAAGKTVCHVILLASKASL